MGSEKCCSSHTRITHKHGFGCRTDLRRDNAYSIHIQNFFPSFVPPPLLEDLTLGGRDVSMGAVMAKVLGDSRRGPSVGNGVVGGMH